MRLGEPVPFQHVDAVGVSRLDSHASVADGHAVRVDEPTADLKSARDDDLEDGTTEGRAERELRVEVTARCDSAVQLGERVDSAKRAESFLVRRQFGLVPLDQNRGVSDGLAAIVDSLQRDINAWRENLAAEIYGGLIDLEIGACRRESLVPDDEHDSAHRHLVDAPLPMLVAAALLAEEGGRVVGDPRLHDDTRPGHRLLLAVGEEPGEDGALRQRDAMWQLTNAAMERERGVTLLTDDETKVDVEREGAQREDAVVVADDPCEVSLVAPLMREDREPHVRDRVTVVVNDLQRVIARWRQRHGNLGGARGQVDPRRAFSVHRDAQASGAARWHRHGERWRLRKRDGRDQLFGDFAPHFHRCDAYEPGVDLFPEGAESQDASACGFDRLVSADDRCKLLARQLRSGALVAPDPVVIGRGE